MVLAVGRFSPWVGINHKKQDLMIDAWRRLVEFLSDSWELHLAGGLTDDPESRSYLEALRQRADGLAVHFHVNVPLVDLKRLYADSAIFWHATGYGETDPQRFEHFGITTVEAMAHGCVPVVPALGGQPEIVDHGVTGYLWRSVDELIGLTMRLMEETADVQRMRPACITAAQRFSKDRFVGRVREHVLIPAEVVQEG
jgi:glycosyltransferase involved in cell wall biosynthesis